MRVTLFVGGSLALGLTLSAVALEHSTAQNVWVTQSESEAARVLRPSPPTAPSAPTAPQPAASATYLRGYRGPGGSAISVFRSRDTDPNQSAIRELLMEYRQTRGESKRKALRAEIEQLTGDSFRKMMQKRRSQLEAAKKRLAEIEQRLDARDELAEQIIERRVANLLDEPDLLEWDFGPTPPAGLPGLTFPGQTGPSPFSVAPTAPQAYPNRTGPISPSVPNANRLMPSIAVGRDNEQERSKAEQLQRELQAAQEIAASLAASESAKAAEIEAAQNRLETLDSQLQETLEADRRAQIETLERYLRELKADASTDSEGAESDDATETSDQN